MIHAVAIVVLSMLACVIYGVAHDQVTARICIEYFTIGHPRVISSTDPTVLACVWGVIATWWVGVLLGIPLAMAARMGDRPPRSVDSLIPSIAILMISTGLFAAAVGGLAYVLAQQQVLQLHGSLALRVPKEQHIAFVVDLWIHNASYLGGFVGGGLLIARVWRSRTK